ncbi:MlaD family protein [Pseudoalteromonas phenolica]|uniref:MlaD family protein n=1 Tax=Pseudoalteromonas phenolica TaxID=161398 RepID=UPI00384F8FEC
MQHNLAKEHKSVIVFVSIGVLFLAITVISVLSSNYTFADKKQFYTELDDALGLKSMPLIYFKGIEIGRVESYDFNFETKKIRAEFWILSEYIPLLTKHSILKSEQHPIFDEVYSFTLYTPEFSYSKEDVPEIREGALILHESSDAAKALEASHGAILPKDDLDSILENINSLLTNLQKEDNPNAGSLFRALDRVAKISEQLLRITDSIEKSGIVTKADQTIEQTEIWLKTLPIIAEKLNESLIRVDKLLITSESVISNYKSPDELVGRVTNNQLPLVLGNINQNLDLVKGMLSEVHTERAQLMMTIYQSQQVLSELEKTLQALNNNPILKGGIKEVNNALTVEVQ